ncbi:SDR family NAD(P)-dependent oxidoreductase [uncultured Oxalicibacterium sp.]|uniref:SDR family NAD(P)-dependent oxidoreductase n=1 Tax=uncultured Oxalicibacterium sp. TaxID=1168540 RepID=UPI0025D181F2|nr:SDR family NAD(P)-dependent oxidoreductase [uncultured Oxalicibacterium sp.]
MIVLVTGASSGFGASIARKFAANGHRVIAAARRIDRLQKLATEIGPSLLPIVMDVTDRQSVETALASLSADWQEIDVLVNNAGLALGIKPAHEASLEDWETMIATNCKGLATVTRLVLPGMVARDRGHVINISSSAGPYAYPGANAYGASKAFVDQFSQNLRADLAGTNVRSCNIVPGLAGGTEFSNVRLKDDAAAAKVYENTTPLGPDDIAEAVFWVTTQPPHVNVNKLEILPTCQGFGPLSIKRRPA